MIVISESKARVKYGYSLIITVVKACLDKLNIELVALQEEILKLNLIICDDS